MKGMLQYVHGTTVLHRLPPLCKLGLAVLLSALCFATGNLLLLALLIGGSVALGALAGIGKQTLRTLLGLCKFSSILFLLQVFFISEGRVVLALPLGNAAAADTLTFASSLGSSVGAGFGAFIAVVVFASLRQRIDERLVPEPMRGLPISLVMASLMCMAFTCVAGIAGGLFV